MFSIVSSLFTGSLTWSLGQTYGSGAITLETKHVHFLGMVGGGTKVSRGWGRTLQRGRQPIVWLNFPKNCIKVKKTGPTLGLVPLWEILDPPL